MCLKLPDNVCVWLRVTQMTAQPFFVSAQTAAPVALFCRGAWILLLLSPLCLQAAFRCLLERQQQRSCLQPAQLASALASLAPPFIGPCCSQPGTLQLLNAGTRTIVAPVQPDVLVELFAMSLDFAVQVCLFLLTSGGRRPQRFPSFCLADARWVGSASNTLPAALMRAAGPAHGLHLAASDCVMLSWPPCVLTFPAAAGPGHGLHLAALDCVMLPWMPFLQALCASSRPCQWTVPSSLGLRHAVMAAVSAGALRKQSAQSQTAFGSLGLHDLVFLMLAWLHAAPIGYMAAQRRTLQCLIL